MTTAHDAEIANAAKQFALDALTLKAQVLVESNGVTSAWNPEPKYHYFWNVKTEKAFRVVTPAEVQSKFPPKDFPALAGDPDQEWWAQQASWGLMQIMGAVAREQGYRGGYLTDLCVFPEVNLRFGCQHLRQLLTRYEGDIVRALCAYNGGPGAVLERPYRTQEYADKVMQMRTKLEGE